MEGTQLPQLVAEFVNLRSTSIQKDYSWKIPSTEPPCQFNAGQDDLMTANIKLRRALSHHWHQMPKDRALIEQWYVSQWGGVRTNSEATLSRYAASDIDQLLSSGVKGIATWSKIVTLRHPDKFAIYDARVAAALHALQIVSGNLIAIFPHVPSRNKIISAFQKANRRPAKKLTVAPSQAYRQYLELLQAVSEMRGTPSLEMSEMCLFTYAEELAREALANARISRT